VDPAHVIWSSPYYITIPRDSIITLYGTASSYVAIYAPTPPAGVIPLGRQNNNQDHYQLIQENSAYLLWGFNTGPAGMTQTGRNLFVNAAHFQAGW
jgi:hypothetical protein